MDKWSMRSLIVSLALSLALAACSSPATPAPTQAPSKPEAAPTAAAKASQPTVQPASKAPASGKSFPTKPIEIIASSTAGSPADIMARELAKASEKILGQSVVVSNKTGGSGGVQLAALMGAAADGYTLGATTAAITGVLNTDLKGNFSLDDFEFIIRTQQDPFILVTKTGRFKDAKEMIEWAKANPGKLSIGGNGTASGQHLTALLFGKLAGFTFKWVPYSGGSEAITAGLGGHVDAVSTAPANIYSFVEAGQATALVHTGLERLPALKDCPTFKELGYDVTLNQWRGIISKRGVPKDVVEILHTSFKKAMDDPGWLDYMKKTNQISGYMAPEEFKKSVEKEYTTTAELLKDVGLSK